MKHLLIALSLATVASLSPARSAHTAALAASDAASGATLASATPSTTQPGTPQRSKMKACNADARTRALHGDDRRAFMKQCLSGKAKAPVAS